MRQIANFRVGNLTFCYIDKSYMEGYNDYIYLFYPFRIGVIDVCNGIK